MVFEMLNNTCWYNEWTQASINYPSNTLPVSTPPLCEQKHFDTSTGPQGQGDSDNGAGGESHSGKGQPLEFHKLYSIPDLVRDPRCVENTPKTPPTTDGVGETWGHKLTSHIILCG